MFMCWNLAVTNSKALPLNSPIWNRHFGWAV